MRESKFSEKNMKEKMYEKETFYSLTACAYFKHLCPELQSDLGRTRERIREFRPHGGGRRRSGLFHNKQQQYGFYTL